MSKQVITTQEAVKFLQDKALENPSCYGLYNLQKMRRLSDEAIIAIAFQHFFELAETWKKQILDHAMVCTTVGRLHQLPSDIGETW